MEDHTTVYLIRHSTPEWPQNQSGEWVVYGPEAPITEVRRLKAAALASELMAREGRGLDAIYSSPLTRMRCECESTEMES